MDQDGDLDEVFRALADPSRRRLLDRLDHRSGQSLRELCAGLEMTRQAVSKHLDVLVAAGVVTTRRQGREKLHYLDAAPINAIADRWMTRYDRHRARALADLATALQTPKETASMDHFVYTTHIRTTPERLWAALTEAEFTRRYWGVSLTSTWEVGATVAWELEGVVMAGPEQVVLEADRPRRLSYRWHDFTPEFLERFSSGPEEAERFAAEGRSRVTFELEPEGELVKLTVVHDGFDPGSVVLDGISNGWPAILSSLKTLLETGEPLPAPQRPAAAPAG